MSDIFDKEKRSQIMSKISGKNTLPEMTIRKLLFSMGYRYRLHRKDLPGSPDIVFPGRKKIIFINGCFWHGHDCKRAALPKSNKDFWESKINGNIERDKINFIKLSDMDWKYLVIWQCEIKKSNLDTLSNKMDDFIRNNLILSKKLCRRLVSC